MTNLILKKRFNGSYRLYTTATQVAPFDFNTLGIKNKVEIKVIKIPKILVIYIVLTRDPLHNPNGVFLPYLHALVRYSWIVETLNKHPDVDGCKIYYITALGRTIYGHTNEDLIKVKVIQQASFNLRAAIEDFNKIRPHKKLTSLIYRSDERISNISRF